MKRMLIALTALVVPFLATGQTDVDALRYSLLNPTGTARYVGVGGAFGALGGDFTTLSVNPAGIGVYRTSEMVFSPAIHSTNNGLSYFGNVTEESNLNFNISNFGLVFTTIAKDDANKPRTSGWISSSFGFGINRLADFHDQIYFKGFNAENSLLDKYAEIAAGTSPSQVYSTFGYDAGLAYEAYLIDPDPTDTLKYISKVPYGGVQQTKDIMTKGSMSEMVVSFGGNYDNRLYLGGTIGIPFLNYESQSTYKEEDINDTIPNFNSFTQFDYLDVSGVGLNLKLGAIYRVNDYIRLGAAIHTPTYLSVNERYFTEIDPNVDVPGATPEEQRSPEGVFDYKLYTPWRFIGSGALVFPKYGFISVDYEVVDYGNTDFGFNSNQFRDFETDLNNSVSRKYGTSSIIRLGGEYVYDIFRLRAGYNIMTTPFNSEVEVGGGDLSRNSWSVGAGIKSNSFFADLAYVRGNEQELHVPYILDDPNETVGGALIDRTETNIILSLGFKF